MAARAITMPPKGHTAAVCMTTTRRRIWENVKIEPISVRIMWKIEPKLMRLCENIDIFAPDYVKNSAKNSAIM